MSADEDYAHYVPRHLDDAGKFLFFEKDVGMVFILVLMGGVMAGYQIIGLIVACIVSFQINKVRAGKHPGIAFHLMYWFAGYPKFKALPPSYVRIFRG